MSSISPLVLPITSYEFKGPIQASTSIAFSDSATIRGSGQLQAATGVALSASGTLTVDGALQASTNVGFTASASLSARASIQASTNIAVGATGTLVTDIVSFGVSPLVLPTTKYNFLPIRHALIGSANVSFSATANLTGTGSLGGNLQASTTLSDMFDTYAFMQGRGQLQASTSIGFTATARPLTGRIAGSASVGFGASGTLTGRTQGQAQTTISFSATASLTQKGGLQAVASIAFDSTAVLSARIPLSAQTGVAVGASGVINGRGRLQASTSMGFGAAATVQGKGTLKGLAVIRFGTSEQIRNIQGATSFSFDATGTLTPKFPRQPINADVSVCAPLRLVPSSGSSVVTGDDAWGGSWGNSWGGSWGGTGTTVVSQSTESSNVSSKLRREVAVGNGL